jgi:hypothetical protein
MTMKRTPRPRDPIQLGKLMVDIATGQVPDAVDDGKDAGAAAMGHKGGLARARQMKPADRSKAAQTAAAARWKASSETER